MSDRFVRGYLAGAIGGFLMSLLNLVSFSLGIAESRHIDLAAIIFIGYVPRHLGEQFISFIIHVGHAALLGIAFAYLVPKIGSRYLLFKGATYGAINWFIVFGVGALYKVPLYDMKSWLTATSHLATSSLWGLFMARALVWLGEPVEAGQACQILAAPAYKPLAKETRQGTDPDEVTPVVVRIAADGPPKKRGLWARLKFW